MRASFEAMVVANVASGLVRIEDDLRKGTVPTYWENSPIMHGLYGLSLAAIRQGTNGPDDLYSLLRLCHKPLSEWPLNLSEYGEDEDTRLMTNYGLTRLCRELAIVTGDVGAELTEVAVMLGAMSACKEARSPHAYSELRKFLIENPVISLRELLRLPASVAFLSEHIRAAYEAVPSHARIQDDFWVCMQCGDLVFPNTSGTPRCENGCFPAGPKKRGSLSDDLMRLHRGLRWFVFLPGRAELRLAKWFQNLGLQVELWPNFDAYDLRVSFPDHVGDEIWAIDVKDWQQPELLARKVLEGNPFPSEPLWTRAFYAFPAEHRARLPHYLRLFKEKAQIAKGPIQAAFDKDLIVRAQKRLSKKHA